jgi:glycosyltransferase involved in cell wall biosynthesis
VLAIFSAIDVFALPTKKEGFGVVFVEAMASVLPVVACDIAPVNTIVKQGETGILVPEDDAEGFAGALKRILEDADLRESMAAAGRTRAFSLFDVDQSLLRTVNLFDRLSSTHEPSSPIAERFFAS